jgi:DNA-directed RNA polymerase subunit RPC12/RpoP
MNATTINRSFQTSDHFTDLELAGSRIDLTAFYKCRTCGKGYGFHELITIGKSRTLCCPDCKEHGRIVELLPCDTCGSWHYEDEYGEDGSCPNHKPEVITAPVSAFDIALTLQDDMYHRAADGGWGLR